VRDSISLREWLDTSATAAARGKAGFVAGMVLVLSYVAMRFLVYVIFPIESIERIPGVAVVYRPGLYPWWVRDTIMDVPRLLTFGLALWVGRYFWGFQRVGWHANRPGLGVIGGAVVVALVFMEAVFRAGPFGYSFTQLMVLSGSSVIVALCEETLFRGVLFTALSEWLGTTVAMWGSAALFTVYHVQAQPVAGWPTIFLIGLFAAVLRWQGVGLAWLIAGHAAADSVFYLGTQGPARFEWWPPSALLLQASVALGYYRWATRAAVIESHRA